MVGRDDGLAQQGKASSSFLKKKPKNFCVLAYVAGETRDSDIKVFCFFSSEKKALFFIMEEQMIGNIVALAAATLLLVAIPGPNVAMIVASSIRHGARCGIVTVAGTTAGVALQLSIILLGFATLLGMAADILTWIKWAGVLYLLYLGIKTWRTPAEALDDVEASTEPASRLFWRGMMLAIVNPKTLLFNAAFLPQFADKAADPARQLLLLGLTFLITLSAGDAVWAIAAGTARAYLRKYGRLRNRITGGFLTASGVGLALARR